MKQTLLLTKTTLADSCQMKQTLLLTKTTLAGSCQMKQTLLLTKITLSDSCQVKQKSLLTKTTLADSCQMRECVIRVLGITKYSYCNSPMAKKSYCTVMKTTQKQTVVK